MMLSVLRFVVAAFLLAVGIASHVQAQSTSNEYSIVEDGGAGLWFVSPSATCTAFLARHAGAPGQDEYSFPLISVSDTQCVFDIVRKSNGGSLGSSSRAIISRVAAPNDSELEQFCASHAKNTFNQKGTIGSSSPTPQSSCYKPYPPFEGADAAKGCEMTLADMVKAPGEDGLMNWSGTGTPTGATCEDAAATDEKPKAEDDKCVGGFSGTVNGVQKCIPAEPDKGIEGVKTGTVTDSDGTKHEIKEETKCEGTQCTTTTTTKTTTTSGTTTTTTKSETQSLTDKCAKDPSNKVCTKTNGGTGGAGSPTGCAANSSGAGCGGAGAGIGGLYEGKDATVQGIMDKAVADLKGSGIGGAVGGFFTVPGGGSAPSMVWNIPYFNVTVSVPGLGSETAMAIYPVLKGVLLLVAGFVAFRIAIDN